MIDFDFDENCYGCGACANACPVNAIEIKQDMKGFMMPAVNLELCISCRRCNKVCIAESSRTVKSKGDKDAYLYVNPDLKTLQCSASGGGFSMLAKIILEHNGYVCGCVFDKDMRARHIVSNDWNDIIRMQGSKYVQSDITCCYDKILEYLRKETYVLFCGTPCQCAAIQASVQGQKGESYLYTGAIICHGVPSPRVWESWKEYLERKVNSSMVYANHRVKGKNYNTPESLYKFENGKSLKMATYLEDLYCFAFSMDVFLRNTCYRCGYKLNKTTADVIMGDYFDFAENNKYRNGVSSVIINTERADAMFGEGLKSAERIDISSVIEKNRALIESVPNNPKRERFFEELGNSGVETAIKHNIPYRKFIIKKVLHRIHFFETLRKVKR